MPRLYYDANGNAKKFCPRCKTLYDNPTENFSQCKSRFDGLSYRCKACDSAIHTAKKYTPRDPEKRRAWQQEYDIKRKDDPERKEHRLEYSRSDAGKEYQRQYFPSWKSIPEHKASTDRSTEKYRQTHRLQIRELSLRRIARKKQTTVDIVDYNAILQRDGLWCYICQQNILSHQSIDFDHVIPLERDGTHTADNIRPTHHICNRRKGKRLLEELTSFHRRGVI